MTKKSWRPLTRPSRWLKRFQTRKTTKRLEVSGSIECWRATVPTSPTASGFAFTPENNSQKAEANSFDTTKRQSDLSPSWVVCQPSRPQRRGVLGQPKEITRQG